MASYLIRRTFQGVITLWVIWSLVFVAYFVAPGDPAAELCRPDCPVQVLQKIREALGLNLPLWQQYLDYFGRIFHGNLGYSYVSGQPVTSIIFRALPVDLSLAIPAGIIWLGVGLLVGSIAARRSDSVGARTATVFILAGLSVHLPPRHRTLLRVQWRPDPWARPLPTPGRQLDAVSGEPSRGGARPGPALDHPGIRVVGNVRPALAKLVARRAGRGVHHCGTRQGPFRAASGLPARAARRDFSDHDPVRDRPRRGARRGDHHRGRL